MMSGTRICAKFCSQHEASRPLLGWIYPEYIYSQMMASMCIFALDLHTGQLSQAMESKHQGLRVRRSGTWQACQYGRDLATINVDAQMEKLHTVEVAQVTCLRHSVCTCSADTENAEYTIEGERGYIYHTE